MRVSLFNKLRQLKRLMLKFWIVIKSGLIHIFDSEFVVRFYIVMMKSIKMWPISIDNFKIHQIQSKMDKNQSKVDQFNQNGQKRYSFLMMDFVIFSWIWPIFDGFCHFTLLINIFIEINQNQSKMDWNSSKLDQNPLIFDIIR